LFLKRSSVQKSRFVRLWKPVIILLKTLMKLLVTGRANIDHQAKKEAAVTQLTTRLFYLSSKLSRYP